MRVFAGMSPLFFEIPTMRPLKKIMEITFFRRILYEPKPNFVFH